MKRLFPFFFPAVFCLALCACSDNSDITGLPDPTQTNANPSDVAYANRLEIPHLKGGDNNLFLVHKTSEYGVNLCIEWDRSKKAQRWAAIAMYKQNSVQRWNRNDWKNTEWGGDPFQVDPTLPATYRTTLEMYRGSGYQRGHIIASADRLNSKDANEQTYYLSNIHPQSGAFNTGLWLQMEDRLRKWNTDTFRDTLYVVKGGTIDYPEHILKYTSSGLLVPRYFFMAVLCRQNNGYKAMGFWAEHRAYSGSELSLKNYVVSIDRLEELTGIDFFCNLPDKVENIIERNVNLSAWPMN